MHVDLYKRLLEADRKVHQFFTANPLPWVQGIMTITTHLGTGAVWVAVYAFFLIFFHDRLTQLIYILVLAEAVVLPALSMIMSRGGHVKLEAGELKVQLRRFVNPEINYAARHICEDFNRMNPMTLDKHRLPIRYEVS